MQNRFLWLCVALLLVVGMGQAPLADEAQYRVLNTGQEGEKVELETHLVEGKLNIIDFYSEYCAPAKAIVPNLQKLAANDPGIVVGTVIINRPGKRGIDWQSPVSQQFRLRSIPHFKIYDGEGKLLAEGQAAKDRVNEMLEESGIK